MFWTYQRTFLGKPRQDIARFQDLSVREWAPIAPLLIMMVWLGCYTAPFLQPISAANQHLLERSNMNIELKVRNHPPSGAAQRSAVLPVAFSEARDGR